MKRDTTPPGCSLCVNPDKCGRCEYVYSDKDEGYHPRVVRHVPTAKLINTKAAPADEAHIRVKLGLV